MNDDLNTECACGHVEDEHDSPAAGYECLVVMAEPTGPDGELEEWSCSCIMFEAIGGSDEK